MLINNIETENIKHGSREASRLNLTDCRNGILISQIIVRCKDAPYLVSMAIKFLNK
jgi:hypothetical protein